MEPVLCPFSLSVEPMAAMLNFEIADDPNYTGLEIQRFDDPVHGTGVAVLLMRRADRRVDVYRQPGLRLDRSSYGIGAGVGLWLEADLEPAVVEVTPTGVLAALGLRDAQGRVIEVRVDDRDGRQRRPGRLLAPVGAAIEQPTSMLLVWMPVFDLVRRGGRGVRITIDGRAVTTGRLPMAWLHGRRLVKCAADVVVVQLNRAREGTLDLSGSQDGAAQDGAAQVGGTPSIAATSMGHTVRLILDPPLPDPRRLPDGTTADGAWRLAIDREASVVGGTWHMQRAGDRVDVVLDSTHRWRPGRQPLLMGLVTRIVPTFRTWPTTYRWRAAVTLGPTPRMASAWERKGAADVDSYRRMMRT